MIRRSTMGGAFAAIALGAICLAAPAHADESLFAQRTTDPQKPQASEAPTPAQAIRQATYLEAEPSRLTAATSESTIALPSAPHGDNQKTSTSAHTLEAMFSVIFSLAMVLGLFFLIAWLVRRGMPSGGSTRLPTEVVDVLGRAPLAGRQQMQLLRLGNKLLLVCISPTGVDTLGEITDPAEADRLAALCRSGDGSASSSIAKSFQKVLDRTSGKPKVTLAAIAREGGNV